MTRNFIDILLICGKKCNFRCSYCFTNRKVDPFKDTINVLEDSLEEVFKHIDYYVTSTSRVKLTFYGGEPLCYINFVRAIFDRYRYTNNVHFCLVTNGSLLLQNKDLFSNISKDRILLCISYDYCLQNSTRKANSYESIRNVIRHFGAEGFKLKTITVITASTLPKIADVYLDYLKLLNENYDNVFGRVNLDIASFKGFDFNLIDQELLNTLKTIKDRNKQVRYPFILNSAMLNRKNISSNAEFLINTYAICPDGKITWDCNSWWHDEYISYLTTGSIFDEPSYVDKLRKDIVTLYGGRMSEECIRCSAKSCKIPAFHWHETESPVFWGTPPRKENNYYCNIVKLISYFLS